MEGTTEINKALITLLKNPKAPKSGIHQLMKLGATVTDEVLLTTLEYCEVGDLTKILVYTNYISDQILTISMQYGPQVISAILKKALEIKANNDIESGSVIIVSDLPSRDISPDNSSIDDNSTDPIFLKSVPLLSLYRSYNDLKNRGKDKEIISKQIFDEIQKRENILKQLEEKQECSSSFEEIS